MKFKRAIKNAGLLYSKGLNKEYDRALIEFLALSYPQTSLYSLDMRHIQEFLEGIRK